MKILVIWPPQVPSYFNAGHHTPLFMVAAHLRSLPRVTEVRALDAGVLNVNWKAVGDMLYQGQFDLVAIMNDFDAIDGLERIAMYVRELCPGATVVTFGRLSSMNSGFFTRYDLDAIVASGDYEAGVAHVARSVLSGGLRKPLPGIVIRVDGRWQTSTIGGESLPAAQWSLPDITEIPYDFYDRLYARDNHKFCGIPFRRELVVPVARGCPVGCSFCEVHKIFGLRERRLSVERVIDYIGAAYASMPFEYVAFYAPTFTLDRVWVRQLSERFLAGPVSPRWKCATTIPHLTRDLVALMGSAGCVRISVGLETLEPDGHSALPKIKRTQERTFRELAQWCTDVGIELNAFIVVGLPGTTADGVRTTLRMAQEVGARVRPTMYAPFHDMTPTMTPLEVSRYNRQLVAQASDPQERAELYQFLFGPEDRLTQIHHSIPLAANRIPA